MALLDNPSMKFMNRKADVVHKVSLHNVVPTLHGLTQPPSICRHPAGRQTSSINTQFQNCLSSVRPFVPTARRPSAVAVADAAVPQINALARRLSHVFCVSAAASASKYWEIEVRQTRLQTCEIEGFERALG